MQVRGTHHSGFTLVEIMIVVAIIGLLASIAIPNFVKARRLAQMRACVCNLKAMEGAKAMWALDHHKGGADVPGDDDLFGLSSYIAVKPACPGNGTYALNAIDAKPVCSVLDHTL